MPATVALRPHDLDRLTASASTRVPSVDLLETIEGWILAAYLSSNTVVVARSLDAGHSWPELFTVATDAANAATPTLWARGRDVFCAYHDAANVAQVYHSES